MDSQGQYFSFDAPGFEQTHAHGGKELIRTRRVRQRGDGTAFNFIDLTVLPVGSDIGLHRHTRDNEEVYVVVTGRGMMTLDGAEFEVSPGDVIVNRPGGEHALRNTGDTELRLVVLEAAVRDPEAAR